MDLEELPRIMLMLRQIGALSRDPDAAGLVNSAAQLMAGLEPLMQLTQELAMQREGEVPESLHWVMLMPLVLQSLQQRAQATPQHSLSEQALSRLPEIIIDHKIMEKLRRAESEAMCPICHEDYVLGQRVLQLPCEHFFCVDCSRQWLRQNSTCPCCRQEVCDEEEEGNDDTNGWHTQDLFPRRYAQGSPLAAVRRARQVQSGGAAELWPPVDDISRIAEEHSAWDTESQSNGFSNDIQAEDLEEHRRLGENIRPQSTSPSLPTPALSRRSSTASQAMLLNSDAHDNPAPAEMPNGLTAGQDARNMRNSHVQRQRQSSFASRPFLHRDGQGRLGTSRGSDGSLPSLSPSSRTSASPAHLTSRTVSTGARAVTRTRVSGSNTGTLQQAQARERRASSNLQR